MPQTSPESPPKFVTPDPFRVILSEAARYWEPRRIGYNLALLGLCAAWVIFTWPHFQPAFTVEHGLQLVVLAALANVCYCAAYLVELVIQAPSAREIWRRRRWGLWLAGTLFALLFACYWIADEIYPYVN